MKIFTLDENQRIHIEIILSAHTGTFDELQPIGAMLAKIRISDEDRAACKLKQEGNAIRWNIRPDTTALIELEDEQARRLIAILKAATVTSADIPWMAPLLS